MSDLPEVDGNLPSALLAWAATERRDLPWRRTRDPWRILVSETMLQQTQVARVLDKYTAFIERFPSAQACAAAPASDVIELWSGLGYNRRAVNLHRASQVIAVDHHGVFPRDLDELLALPGVGPYTARALQAFAYEIDVGVVDTNVGRLLARWSGQTLTPRGAQTLADVVVPDGQGWAWNQSLFDFAVAVCTKRAPSCERCPVQQHCSWRGRGPDPAHKSAAVTGPQSKFENSQRQVRGRIVDALRGGPIARSELTALGRACDTASDVERIVAGLVADGLVSDCGDHLTLPD